MNEYIVNLLVFKIKSKEINPKTKESFKVEDIKLEDIKLEVEKRLVTQ